MVRRVVLTRPEAQNAALIQRLSGHDIEVLSAPALSIGPVLDPTELAAVPRPDEVDLVVFVSGNAARYYLELCHSRPGWMGWPAGVAGAAVARRQPLRCVHIRLLAPPRRFTRLHLARRSRIQRRYGLV